MMNLENPFEKELQRCQDEIKEYEACLAKEHERKNLLLTQIADFYTLKLQGSYYRCEDTGRLGQIDKAFFKAGKFFLHVYYLDVTANMEELKVQMEEFEEKINVSFDQWLSENQLERTMGVIIKKEN